MARQERFELPTYCLEGSCSILLSYWRISKRQVLGAGDGNRTHVSSLEGWCSTIELHPHNRSSIFYTRLSRHSSYVSASTPAWLIARVYVKQSATIDGFLRNAQNRNRTSDTRIFSPLLYQLSYLGFSNHWTHRFSTSFILSNHTQKVNCFFNFIFSS